MKNYRTPLNYGLYGAVLGLSFYLMLLFSGNSPWSSSSWLGAWIPGVTAFLSIKKHLSLKIEPYSTFSEVFRIALIAIMVQAVLYNLFTLVFGVLFETGALEMYHVEVAEQAEQISSIFGEELYDKMMEEIKQTTLSTLAISDFTYKIIGGVIVSLILAASMKKNKPLFETNE